MSPWATCWKKADVKTTNNFLGQGGRICFYPSIPGTAPLTRRIPICKLTARALIAAQAIPLRQCHGATRINASKPSNTSAKLLGADTAVTS